MSHPRLSCARRFVLVDAGGHTVADGIVFALDGPVVIYTRDTGAIEVHEPTVLTLKSIAGHIEWIDAQRPTPCTTPERTTDRG